MSHQYNDLVEILNTIINNRSKFDCLTDREIEKCRTYRDRFINGNRMDSDELTAILLAILKVILLASHSN